MSIIHSLTLLIKFIHRRSLNLCDMNDKTLDVTPADVEGFNDSYWQALQVCDVLFNSSVVGLSISCFNLLFGMKYTSIRFKPSFRGFSLSHPKNVGYSHMELPMPTYTGIR